MPKRFSIHTLDEYAKTLTLRQAAALYECKTSKKAVRPIFESGIHEEAYSDRFTFYLSPSVIEDYIIPAQPENSVPEIITDRLGTTDNDIEFVNDVYEPGMMVFVRNEELYDRLINLLIEEFEIPDDIVEDNIDPKFKN